MSTKLALVSVPSSQSLWQQTHEWMNREITKLILGPEEIGRPGSLAVEESRRTGRSFMTAVIAQKMMHQRILEDWVRQCSLWGIPCPTFGKQRPLFGQGKNAHKPKWGQRGRGRKRKMRLADRARKHR